MKTNAIFAAALSLPLLFGFALCPRAQAAGSAPVAENLELCTQRDTPVAGTLSAHDADGDIVSFEITTDPVKGDIVLEDGGRLVYTPRPGRKGRDYFGFRAADSEGNVSQEATGIIRIER